MTTRFNDRVVIVTGAGQGIGYGLCKAFAEAGATVALNDIDGDLAQRAADKINAGRSHDVATPYALDVADVDAVRTMADDPEYDSNWQRVTPNQRVAQVEDVVQTALFVASPQARHITGQTIVVDGGWTRLSPIPEETPDIPTESSKLR